MSVLSLTILICQNWIPDRFSPVGLFYFLARAVGERGGGPRCGALSVTVPYSRLKFDLVIGVSLIILI